jgi:hypothetical protein
MEGNKNDGNLRLENDLYLEIFFKVKIDIHI